MSDYPKPAFPEPRGGGCTPGMTLRDYFAAQAIAGILGAKTEINATILAKNAYFIADAMLEARK